MPAGRAAGATAGPPSVVEQRLELRGIRHAEGEGEAEQDAGLPRVQVPGRDPAALGELRDRWDAPAADAGRLDDLNARGRGTLERGLLAGRRVAGARAGIDDRAGTGRDGGLHERTVGPLVRRDDVDARQVREVHTAERAAQPRP